MGMKVSLKEGINNYIEDNYPELVDDILLADGFEEAFLGVSESFDHPPRACYDSSKCISILQTRDEMDTGEAIEFFEFNIRGAYVGEYTPMWIFPFDKEYDCVSAEEPATGCDYGIGG